MLSINPVYSPIPKNNMEILFRCYSARGQHNQSGNVSRSGNTSVHFSGVHNQFVEGNIHAGAYLTNFYTGFSQVKANNQWWHFTECKVDDDSQNHMKSKSQ